MRYACTLSPETHIAYSNPEFMFEYDGSWQYSWAFTWTEKRTIATWLDAIASDAPFMLRGYLIDTY